MKNAIIEMLKETAHATVDGALLPWYKQQGLSDIDASFISLNSPTVDWFIVITVGNGGADAREWSTYIKDAISTHVHDITQPLSGGNKLLLYVLNYVVGIYRCIRERKNKVHTSYVKVGVQRQMASCVNMKLTDIRIETMRSSGKGGQHVNKTESKVRVTYLKCPALTTISEASRKQSDNLERALEQLQIKALAFIEHWERSIWEQLSTQITKGNKYRYTLYSTYIMDHNGNTRLKTLSSIFNQKT